MIISIDFLQHSGFQPSSDCKFPDTCRNLLGYCQAARVVFTELKYRREKTEITDDLAGRIADISCTHSEALDAVKEAKQLFPFLPQEVVLYKQYQVSTLVG